MNQLLTAIIIMLMQDSLIQEKLKDWLVDFKYSLELAKDEGKYVLM